MRRKALRVLGYHELVARARGLHVAERQQLLVVSPSAAARRGGKGKENSSEPKGKAATATHPLATGGEKNRGLSSFLLEIFPFLVPFQNNVYSRDSPCTTRPQQGGTVHGHTDKTELLL